MSRYPFDENWIQLDRDHCPAPWCGRDLTCRLVWITAAHEPLVGSAAMFSDLSYRPGYKYHRLYTCYAAACREWARLRAQDIARSDYHRDPYRWLVSDYYRGVQP